MDLPEVAVLEDIYAPNLKSNLPHPHVPPTEKETHVYYLAYGSNMYSICLLPSRHATDLYAQGGLYILETTWHQATALARCPRTNPRAGI